MKTLLTLTVALLVLIVVAPAQKRSVVIGSRTDRPNALLIVNPQNSDQGVLLPQLSTGQRMSMKPSSPSENGLIVFDSNKKSYFYWSDGSWVRLRGDNAGFTRYQSIDPAHFQSLKTTSNSRHDNLVIFESDNAFATASREEYGEQIIAPLSLPHGSVINDLTIYYMDNDDDNMRISLVRKTMAGESEQLLHWETSGSSSAIKSQAFTTFNGLETVDLEHYTYRIVVSFDLDAGEIIDTPSKATQRLYGIKIKYQE